ncbi:MAG: hypothetical protein HN909_05700, partial [Phycisphaerales bacterium]|nr:hypothetical protein [Phycisphaerales bacterium]
MNRLLYISMLALLCGGCMERRVRISTQPDGVMVFVNDQPVGISPCEIKVPPQRDELFSDPYIIEATAENHLPVMYYLPPRRKSSMAVEEVHLKLTPMEGTALLAPPAAPRPNPAPIPDEIPTARPLVQDPVSPPEEPSPPAETGPAAPILVQRLDAQAPTSAIRFNCEVRLVRMKDGATLIHASTLGTWSDRDALGDLLAKRIQTQWPDGRLAVISFRNRRRSPAGKTIASKMTDLLARKLELGSEFQTVRTFDLVDSGIDPMEWGHSDILKHKALAPHLAAADYVLLGGTSESA